MEYEIIDAIQGTDDWLNARKSCFTASEAPAAFGKSKYMSRDKLLAQKSTGLIEELNVTTQALFNKGHETEAMARKYAEELIGEELYPITAKVEIAGLPLLASLDGITMDNLIIFEHKLLSAPLVKQVESGLLDEHYSIQLDQQLLVTGAKKALFVTSDGTRDNFYSMWYEPEQAKFDQLIAHWHMFDRDLANYVMPEVIEKVIGADVQSLPVPSVQVKGELVACNLAALTPMFDKFLTETNTKLTTDQDFSDADINAKKAREAACNLKITAKSIVNQMASVSEVVSTLENYAKAFDTLGLSLEKAVKEQKELIKSNAILKAKQEYLAHIASLEVEIKPIRLTLPAPDFATAIKGLKTLESLHSKIRTTYTQGIIDADADARDIRAKLTWFNEVAADFKPLFADLSTFIIYKPLDDFKMIIDTRIASQVKIEAERAERVRLEAEKQAEIKANAEAQAKQYAMQEVENMVALSAERAEAIPALKEKAEQIAQKAELVRSQPVSSDSKAQPSAESLVMAIASAFRVSNYLAHTWLAKTDFSSKALEAA